MASNAGAKVFLDIMPRLGAGSLERVLQSISGRVGTFSGDINKSLGAGIGNSASTAMEREGARIDAALKSAQASVERSTEAMARSQDAQNVSFLKLKAAEANYTEQFASESEKRRAIQALERGDWDAQAAAAEASTSRQISAISRLESRRAAYEASLRASSRAEAGGAAATAGLNEAQRDKDAFGDAEAASLGRVGKAATVATAGIGIGLAGAMYEGTKRSMDLNQQLTLLTTSAGESTKNIGTLKQGVLDLQSQYGYSADDLTKALRTIEQSGYHGSDAIKVLTTTTKESVLENANLDSVAHLLTTTMEDYGDKLGNVTDVQGRANKAAELQVATIGQSKATLDEYTASLGSVEEYAHTAGVSISDLNASFAEMTQHGITPQQSTDYLKSNIRVLSDPKQGQTTELNNDHLSVAQVQGSLQTQGIAATDEMISKAIMAKMGPDGRVLLNTYNDSKDQRQSADTMLQALKNDHPDEYAIASQFATDQSAASANPDKAAGSAASGKAQDTFAKAVRAMPVADQGRLKQWQTTFQKSQGFNDLLRSGRGDSESYLQAMNRAFGTQEASQTAQNLTGSNYQGVLDRQGAINANANDSVFNKEVGEQQDNLKARLKDLDGSFHSFETELGDTTQGPLKWFVAGLADSVKWLTQHKGVMDSLIAAAGIAAGTLAAIKVTNSVSTLLGAKQPLGTRMASGAITKTGNAIKKTGAAIGKGGAIAANYVGSYSEEVAAVATGAKEGVAAGLSGMKAGAISAATTAKDKAVTAAGTAGLAIDATTTKAKQVGNAALDRTAAAMYMAPTVIGNKAGELSNRASLSGLALAEQAGMGASAAAGGIAAAGSKLKGAASKIGGAGGKVGRVGMGVAAAGLPIAMIAGSGKANADDGSGKKQGTDWSEYAIDAAVAAPAVPAVAGAVKSVGVGAVKTAKAAPAAASKAVDKGKNIASTVGNAASAVGDFGGGAATKAADSIGKAGKAIKDFQGGAKLAEKAVQAWKLAQGGLQAIMSAGPIGIVVVAIAALVAGVIYAYTHFKWFRDAVNDVWNWMKKFAEWVAKEFMQMWHSAINDLKEIWSFLYDKVFKYYIDQVKSYLNDFIGFFKNIGKGIGDVLGGIKDLFQGHTDGIKKIWDGLKEIAAAPVRFIVNTVYNDGILKLWNGVAGVFHLDSMKLTPIQFSGGGIAGDDSGVVHAAGGTVLPGYTPGRDSIPAMLSPGEG
ncbi:MAG: phage tail tape measure protein, partial [Mycobacterium sp.]|nr:phage tail tape measure protein [Mycobacterium sp.]